MNTSIAKYFKRKRENEDSVSSVDDSEDKDSNTNDSTKSWNSKFDKSRVFQSEWTENFLFIETADPLKSQCLVYHIFISGNRGNNLSRHYDLKHKEILKDDYPLNSAARQIYIKQLKSCISKQTAFLKVALSESECVTLASFKLAKMIAVSQRPFSEGEFIKSCFIESAKILFAE